MLLYERSVWWQLGLSLVQCCAYLWASSIPHDGLSAVVLPAVCRCLQCIYAWLERKNTCPLCESPMDLQDDILL